MRHDQLLVFSDQAIESGITEYSYSYCELGEGEITLTDGLLVSAALPIPPVETCSPTVSDARTFAQWCFVCHWLSKNSQDCTQWLIDQDHPLTFLALLNRRLTQTDYFIRVKAPIKQVSDYLYALLGSAEGILYLPGTEKNLDSYVGSTPRYTRLPVHRSDYRPSGTTHSSQCKKKLLLVSYFAGACSSVGCLRINYWYDHFKASPNFDVHLATAAKPAYVDSNIHWVPDLHSAYVVEKNGTVEHWALSFSASQRQEATRTSTLSAYWRIGLERYFADRDDHFDIVLISGNPFSCFDFAAFCKSHWNAKVVLDYRDPFANNPRMSRDQESLEYTRHLERGYNFMADAITTVNQRCVELLEHTSTSSIHIIPNGFNEKEAEKLDTVKMNEDTTNFVHAGTFYPYGDPEPFISSLGVRSSLHLIGRVEKDVISHGGSSIQNHGRLSYTNTLSIISGADCGLIYLSNDGFESTTKVFDYLACGLDILLLYSPPLAESPLLQILEGYPGVIPVPNGKYHIAKFLDTYTPNRDGIEKRKRATQALSKVSRLTSTQKLEQILTDLVS